MRQRSQALSWRVIIGPLLTLSLLLAYPVHGELRGSSKQKVAAADLRQLSLEDLLSLEVTSVSKKPERLTEAAAAVFVLTGEEIRRSGATTLPEVLRLVPGLMVARSDAHTWAISARGFTSTTANKLEVLLDGRSLYTPLFSGVFWDVQDTLLADIDRIEVIRGPGATLWGANAVNGVINILTLDASETQGTHVGLGIGTELEGLATARYGGQTADGTSWRLWAKAREDDASELIDGRAAPDGWQTGRVGFRIDRDLKGPLAGSPSTTSGDDAAPGRSQASSGTAHLTVQGDVYAVRAETPDTSPVLPIARNVETESEGVNLLARWSREFRSGSDLQFQAFFDYTSRDIPGLFFEDRSTFDLDLQHRMQRGRHELIWGLGYRLSSDDVENTPQISWVPPSRDLAYYGAFLQDEIRFHDDALRLILGTKLEHNDYTGFEAQPTVRLLWAPEGRNRALWGAFSRAVRTPSRLDDDIRLRGVISEQPRIDFVVGGSDAFEPEELMAYELGARFWPAETVSIDVAAFYHDYDHLASLEGPLASPLPGDPAPPPGQIVLPFLFGNQINGTSHGLEAVAVWQPSARWRINAAWTYFELDLSVDAGSQDTITEVTEGNEPHHQLSLRSLYDLGDAWQLNAVVRYVDALPNLRVPSYTELDLHLSWQLTPQLKLAVIGQNLLDDRHLEFGPTSTAVERNAYVRASWSF